MVETAYHHRCTKCRRNLEFISLSPKVVPHWYCPHCNAEEADEALAAAFGDWSCVKESTPSPASDVQ